MPEKEILENINPSFHESQKNTTEKLPEKKEVSFESDREKEITRENLQEVQKQTVSNTPKKKVKKKIPSISISQETNSIREMDDARKVETLSAIAFEKGIARSINIAMKLQDPFILDALHDKLVKDYEGLVKRGKLKEI